MNQRRRSRFTATHASLATAGAGVAAAFVAVAFLTGTPDDPAPADLPAVAGDAAATTGVRASDPAALDTRLTPEDAPQTRGVSVPGMAGVEGMGAPGPSNPHLEFVVQFEGEWGRQWLERYLENPRGARAAFYDFAEQNDAFRGLRLLRVNPRGQCTLAWDGPAPPSEEALQDLSEQVVERLKRAPNVEYAEPNLILWRG